MTRHPHTYKKTLILADQRTLVKEGGDWTPVAENEREIPLNLHLKKVIKPQYLVVLAN